MNPLEIYDMQELIDEYGAREALRGFILALRQSADNMSDLMLKERAIYNASMAQLLQKIDDVLE